MTDENNKMEMSEKENLHSEMVYQSVRSYVVDAQRQVYFAVNTAMVTSYWNIGKTIYEACGEKDRAAYGKQVLQYISERLTAEFGKGFTVRNLRAMRQFYLSYPIRHTVCAELSWSHYRLLIRVANEKERLFYTEEAAKSGWSVRQLERQINTMFYQRLLTSRDKESVAAEIQTTVPKPEYENLVRLTLPEENRQIYAAKYMPYMPTEEELKRELNLSEFEKLED